MYTEITNAQFLELHNNFPSAEILVLHLELKIMSLLTNINSSTAQIWFYNYTSI